MVEEITKEIGVAASPSFTASLVELVYNQIIATGEDLELFATHAGRSVIQPSDVYMVTRRNEVLTKALKEVEETLRGLNLFRHPPCCS